MKKNTLIPALIFLVLVIITISFVNKDNKQEEINNQALKTDIILFYGSGCQYCGIVDEFLKEKEVEKVISFKSLEVYNNQANATLLKAKARACDLNTNSIGVPFLWDGKDCLIGDKAIISFFENKLATLESLSPENAIVIDDFVSEEGLSQEVNEETTEEEVLVPEL